jgi:hypothetical protein
VGRREIAELVRLILAALAATASILAADQVTYRNTKPGVAYVGSRACAGCHAKIYQDYSTTAMGRSMDLATSSGQRGKVSFTASVFAQKLNRHYEIYRQGQDIFQTDYELDPSGREVFRASHKLEYAIGSGVNGFTYIVRRGDYLFQAPLSYYSRQQAWDLSPGYESADYGFNRPVAAACIYCHSGQPQPLPDREGLFANPPFRELAIGCENCHGPGTLHVAERSQPNSTPQKRERTIVNPAALPARLAEDICMNCHQGGDTRILVPGKSYSDFRPGTPLRDTLAILRIPPKRGDPRESDLLEHHLSMQLSKCFRASDGRLSCLTCHQIHYMPRPAEAGAYYRTRCLSCHTKTACKLTQAQRRQHDDDCTACHMPKRDVQLIAHSALTNHRIVARPDEPLPEAAFHETNADLPDLVYLNCPAASDRASLPAIMLLQAYGELMERDPDYRVRYFAALDELSRSSPDQPLVQAALGRKALLENASIQSAIEHLTRAIQLGFAAPTVYQDLATALVRVGRETDAVRTLQHGIELSSYTPALYKLLALSYINLKQYPEAKKTLELYVSLFPEDDFMRGLLLKVQGTSASGGR